MLRDNKARTDIMIIDSHIKELAVGMARALKDRDARIADLETTHGLLKEYYGLEEVELPGTPEIPSIPAVPPRRIIREIKKKR